MSEVINFKPKYGQVEEGNDDASVDTRASTAAPFSWPAALRDQLNSNFREKISHSAENREHKMKKIKVKRLSTTAEARPELYGRPDFDTSFAVSSSFDGFNGQFICIYMNIYVCVCVYVYTHIYMNIYNI
jgi:hypothetical protein